MIVAAFADRSEQFSTWMTEVPEIHWSTEFTQFVEKADRMDSELHSTVLATLGAWTHKGGRRLCSQNIIGLLFLSRRFIEERARLDEQLLITLIDFQASCLVALANINDRVVKDILIVQELSDWLKKVNAVALQRMRYTSKIRHAVALALNKLSCEHYYVTKLWMVADCYLTVAVASDSTDVTYLRGSDILPVTAWSLTISLLTDDVSEVRCAAADVVGQVVRSSLARFIVTGSDVMKQAFFRKSGEGHSVTDEFALQTALHIIKWKHLRLSTSVWKNPNVEDRGDDNYEASLGSNEEIKAAAARGSEKEDEKLFARNDNDCYVEPRVIDKMWNSL